MGADSTLVNAAFKESQSRYAGDVIDMKPLYDSNAAINTKATNLILGAIDIYSKEQKVKKDGIKAQLDIFNQNAEDANVKYYKNGEPMDQLVINAVQDKIKGLQAEFELVNTFGKNDNAENERARARLNASLKQIVATLNYNRTGLMKLNDSKGDINTGTVKTENLIAFNKVLSGEYDEVGFDESNNLLYKIYDTDDQGRLVSKSYTFQQLEKGLPMLDKTAEANDIAQQNANTTLALNNGATSKKGNKPDYNHKIAADNYMQMINSKQSFATLANNTNVDGNPTFKQSLEKNQVLFNDLVNLLPGENVATDVLDELDGKRDGNVGEKAISELNATQQQALLATNIAEVIAILTDDEHTYFDLDRSKKLLANYKADLGRTAYDYHWQNEYDKRYPKPSGGGSGMTYAQALAKQNLETAVSNINSTYTEILKDDEGDDFDIGKKIAAPNKQGTFVMLHKDESGKWLWYGHINGNPTGEKWPMGTGGKPDPKMVNWLTNSQVMSVSSGFDPNDY
jgi:hypothetical protein